MARRASKKGAFDISLGFIIIVVFAIVLLTLGITWLQGVLKGIGGLTDDLTQQASTKLQETFQQSTSNFAVWPPTWTIEKGKGIKMSAGIKNNAPDGATHPFVVNIVPLSVSDSIKALGSCTSIDNCNIPIDGVSKSLKTFMMSWVTWSSTPSSIDSTSVGFTNIDLVVPIGTPSGVYQFGAVACRTDITGTGGVTVANGEQCTTVARNWGGSVQPIQITVK